MAYNNLKSFIEEKEISGILKEQLKALGKSDELAIWRIVKNLNPSVNALREIINIAGEIARRDDARISDVLSKKQIVSIIADEKVSKKDRIKKLSNSLDQLRNPLLSKVRNELDLLQKELLKNTGLKVDLPKDLEGDSLSLNLRFKSNEELKDISKKIEKIADSPELVRIYQILKGQF